MTKKQNKTTSTKYNLKVKYTNHKEQTTIQQHMTHKQHRRNTYMWIIHQALAQGMSDPKTPITITQTIYASNTWHRTMELHEPITYQHNMSPTHPKPQQHLQEATMPQPNQGEPSNTTV